MVILQFMKFKHPRTLLKLEVEVYFLQFIFHTVQLIFTVIVIGFPLRLRVIKFEHQVLL